MLSKITKSILLILIHCGAIFANCYSMGDVLPVNSTS